MKVLLCFLIAVFQRGLSFIPSFVPKLHARVRAVQSVPAVLVQSATPTAVEDSLRKQVY